jgi:murein DD-endopeptidase MepM/ murein hydrolase activator NlpD
VVAAPARPADRPAVASVPAAGATVTVQSGDTIYGLARRHGVSAGDIMRANGLKPDSSLVVGRKIVIPGAAGGNIAAAAPVQPAGKAPLPAKPDLVATLPAKTKAEPVVAAAPKPVGGNGTYTVASGDSLYTIAKKLGTTTEALKQANGLKDGYLKIGQTLNVPGASAAPTQVAAAKPARTDPVVTNTAAAQARSPEVAAYTPPKATETAVKAALEETGTAPTATGIGKMRWPVRGKVVSGFGDSSAGKANDGIDISVPEGTPVKAAENGIVIYAGDGLKEFGNTVLVRHEDGTVTVYGHASKLNVTRGEKVKRGQDIALSGMSGSTDRPKLHFEVRKNSSPVNPSGYLE